MVTLIFGNKRCTAIAITCAVVWRILRSWGLLSLVGKSKFIISAIVNALSSLALDSALSGADSTLEEKRLVRNLLLLHIWPLVKSNRQGNVTAFLATTDIALWVQLTKFRPSLEFWNRYTISEKMNALCCRENNIMEQWVVHPSKNWE